MLLSKTAISPYVKKTIFTGFSPLNVRGLQLYMAKDNATVSSWLDQSTNAFDFVQATATQQPTISTNSVDYDGTNDVQRVAAAQPLNFGDYYFFFSGYFDSTSNNYLFCSADESGTSEYFIIQMVAASGLLRVQAVSVVNSFSNIFTSTNAITNGEYFYGYVKFNSGGSNYVMSLNGNTETIIVTSGSNNGKGLSNVASRDNMTIGALVRSVSAYGTSKVNKLLVSNAVLTTEEVSEIDNFMSDPTNY